MRERFSVQSAQRLYNATLVEHQTVPNEIQLSIVQFQELTDSDSDSEIYRRS
jgi:hypothetical protein